MVVGFPSAHLEDEFVAMVDAFFAAVPPGVKSDFYARQSLPFEAACPDLQPSLPRRGEGFAA
eukprot:3558475-Lingulodinium_polyedra.AAC.1